MITCPVVLSSRHPTELELIKSYLLPRITSGDDSNKSWEFIHHADVYTADPTSLTEMFPPARTIDGEEVWYFFSPVKTKSVHGQRKVRTVKSGAGCWHSEAGTKTVWDDRGHRVGHRQFFSFVTKEHGRRVRTGWLMVELGIDNEHQVSRSSELVLCKIYMTPREASTPSKGLIDGVEEHMPSKSSLSPSSPPSSSSPPASPYSSPPSSPSSASPPSPTSSMSPSTPPLLSMSSLPALQKLSSSLVVDDKEEGPTVLPESINSAAMETIQQPYF
ncbi:hypothetical protein BRADI_2g46483v3, partial [Brachypodium distachyon]